MNKAIVTVSREHLLDSLGLPPDTVIHGVSIEQMAGDVCLLLSHKDIPDYERAPGEAYRFVNPVIRHSANGIEMISWGVDWARKDEK